MLETEAWGAGGWAGGAGGGGPVAAKEAHGVQVQNRSPIRRPRTLPKSDSELDFEVQVQTKVRSKLDFEIQVQVQVQLEMEFEVQVQP
jgi:hypothetical protein